MKLHCKSMMAMLFWILFSTSLAAENLKGRIIDAKTGEPLMGATIRIEGQQGGAVSDIDGNFTFQNLAKGLYNLTIDYVAYRTKKVSNIRLPQADTLLTIPLVANEQMLQSVQIVGIARKNTEAATIKATQESHLVVNAVSSQEITRAQDSNAGEVIKRVSGVSLIEDKFVMVRGLSQRYNNVWINGGAVPASEADSRAFSFDLLPGSQLDNIEIIKTPSPEYPADYSGGFILVHTKEIPPVNVTELSLGTNINDATTFQSSQMYKEKSTDFIGYDLGKRSLPGGMQAVMHTLPNGGVDLQNNKLDNQWNTEVKNPLPDLKLGLTLARNNKNQHGKWGWVTLLNYTHEWRNYENMENNLFGLYDTSNDRSNYLRHSIDNQYNRNVRIGAMANATWLSLSGNDKLQWKNIFNRLTSQRYTQRQGISAQANKEASAEYYYSARTAYNTQFTGQHQRGNHQWNWSLGYAFANRSLPDRRRYLIDDAIDTDVLALTTGNDVSREWTYLYEHIASLRANGRWKFTLSNLQPTLNYGIYTEYRTRDYRTRDFFYAWNAADNTLPQDFRTLPITQLLSNQTYFGTNGLYLIEQINLRNNYQGNNTHAAAFAAIEIPLNRLHIYAGLRTEYNRMQLISNTRDDQPSPLPRNYHRLDLFPSINTVYRLSKQHQWRLSYGRTINRPEFRERSPAVYYDFDLASNVQGNTELKNAYIDNLDLRYEWYPQAGEQVSVALFYKHFDKPIEWVYTVAGGTDLIYSYKNAKAANNIGLEVDIRKRLDFLSLPQLSWAFNGSLIFSRVVFNATDHEEPRAMQGQSPYLINTGLFYQLDKQQLSIALLYNRIGKRIIGVGRSEGTTAADELARIPDSYEMPKDVIDCSIAKKWGKHIEVKLSVRDILAQTVYYKQFAKVKLDNQPTKTIDQTTRAYRPGRNIVCTFSYKL